MDISRRKQQLAARAMAIAEVEAARERPLLALLTGSAAWGVVSERSDIDIIFITATPDVVSYRYYLPEMTGVEVRTEVGRVPLAYLEKVLATGYSDEITTGLREQLRNAQVLFGESQTAKQAVTRFSGLKPKARLLGEYLSRARAAFARAAEALPGTALLRALLALDEVSVNLWRLILVAKYRIGVQKDKHEIRAARGALGEHELSDYLTSRRVSGVAKSHAGRVLLGTHKTILKIFELNGIDGSIVGDVEGV
jgi:hypothetical protein